MTMIPFHRYGAVIDSAPQFVQVGGTVTLRVHPVHAQSFEFEPSSVVQIYPWSPQLESAIYYGTGSYGAVFIQVPSIQVLSSTDLRFQVPSDADRIRALTGNDRFLANVLSPSGPAWAWARTSFSVSSMSAPAASPAAAGFPIPTFPQPAAQPTPPPPPALTGPIVWSLGPAPASSMGSPSSFAWLVQPTSTAPGTITLSLGSGAASPPSSPTTSPPVPGAPTGSASAGAALPTTPSWPVQPGRPQAAEAMVRWLVESMSPIRQDPGPDTLEASMTPGSFQGDVPVESGQSPRIERFNVIVSAQLLLPDESPVRDERLTFRFLDETDLPGDDSRLVEVANGLPTLRSKLKAGATGSGVDYAYTNQEGKVYCWFELALFDDAKIADTRLKLRGFKVIVGENTDPPAARSGVAATASNASPAAAALTRGGGWFNAVVGLLEDVLVEPTRQAIVTAVEFTQDGIAEARAAIARTVERVTGFALARFADGVAVVFLRDFPTMETVVETARGAMLGAFLGIPRGLWVMARDQVQDLKAMVFDLPRALYNFFAEDPRFALEVLGSLLNPAVGNVIYNLDPDFRRKIRGALRRFQGLAENAVTLLTGLWDQVKTDVGVFSEAVGGMIYDSFSDFVGGIATEYLGFHKNSAPYKAFVAGFIAGDFLGYILGTVGVQVLTAYATAGIGAWVAAVAKVGRLSALAHAAAPLVRFIAALKDAFGALGDVIRRLGITAKEAVGKVILCALRLLDSLLDDYVKPVVELLADETDKIVGWLLRSGHDAAGVRLTELAEGVARRGPQVESEVVKRSFEVMAELSSPHPSGVDFVPSCR